MWWRERGRDGDEAPEIRSGLERLVSLSKGRGMEHKIVFRDLVIGGSAQRPFPRPRKRPDHILPLNLPPLGLTLEAVAAFVGISPNKYSDLIRRGLMPRARLLDGRRVHDREAAHAAFKRLPMVGDTGSTGDKRQTSTWEDIDNAS